MILNVHVILSLLMMYKTYYHLNHKILHLKDHILYHHPLLLLELAVYIFPALSIVIPSGLLPVVPKIVDTLKGVILLTLLAPKLAV
jgi:hypothetical protein